MPLLSSVVFGRKQAAIAYDIRAFIACFVLKSDTERKIYKNAL
jgi:hypothetical protein